MDGEGELRLRAHEYVRADQGDCNQKESDVWVDKECNERVLRGSERNSTVVLRREGEEGQGCRGIAGSYRGSQQQAS